MYMYLLSASCQLHNSKNIFLNDLGLIPLKCDLQGRKGPLPPGSVRGKRSNFHERKLGDKDGPIPKKTTCKFENNSVFSTNPVARLPLDILQHSSATSPRGLETPQLSVSGSVGCSAHYTPHSLNSPSLDNCSLAGLPLLLLQNATPRILLFFILSGKLFFSLNFPKLHFCFIQGCCPWCPSWSNPAYPNTNFSLHLEPQVFFTAFVTTQHTLQVC